MEVTTNGTGRNLEATGNLGNISHICSKLIIYSKSKETRRIILQKSKNGIIQEGTRNNFMEAIWRKLKGIYFP